jgi:hypothetical protein
MTSFKTLPKTNQDIVKNWINNAGIKSADTTNLSWIVDHVDKVEAYIKKYSNVNTRKTHFTTLSKVAGLLKKTKIAEKYSVIATKLNKLHVEKSKEQKPKTNQLLWSNIMKKRKEYKDYTAKFPTRYKSHLDYLILSLYSYQPPIRSEWTDMIFKKEKPIDKSKNYLWKHDDKYTIILNNYKTSETYGQANIDIVSKRLINILNDSFSRFPRKYVLSLISDKQKPMGYQNFYKYRAPEIFKKKSGVFVDDLRSAYITQFYNNRSMDDKNEKEEHNIKDKEKLAKQMTHSASEAYSTYYKLTGKKIAEDENMKKKKQKEYYEKKKKEAESSDSETETDDSETDSDEDEKKAKPKPKPKPQKKPFDRKAYAKAYKKKHPEKFAKAQKKYYENNKQEYLRKKIIHELNTGNTSNPKDSTITKYKLIYNTNTKKWS